MKFTKTKIEGVYVIDLEPRGDARGYFTRVFCKDELRKVGIKYEIAQVNRSFTVEKGTIRGLHYQRSPEHEDKIIQCVKGSIFDVALDLRKKSKTYGKWFGLELSEKNKRMLLIPKGCAHAFQTLVKNVAVEYFVSEYYSPNYESGIRWDDPAFKVAWPIKKPKLSDKDANWPLVTKTK